jgi:hypothetical protein
VLIDELEELPRDTRQPDVINAIRRLPVSRVARCLEVEVTSQGETIEAAIDNLTEALGLYFEDHIDEVPESPAIIAPVELAG